MKKITVIGTGDICSIYLYNIQNVFRNIEVRGVYDLVHEKAEQMARAYQIPIVFDTLQDALTDSETDIILNLTRPLNHYEISREAILAGKHVYSEKPFGVTFEQALELCQLAREHGVLVGGAPDTFLGGGIQTCRKLLDDGVIGRPIGASAYMVSPGLESWHPDPSFYYSPGGGPMLDMGPYYVTALVSLLGPVVQVAAMTKASYSERIITNGPRFGTAIPVTTPTYLNGVMQFQNGVIGSMLMTFDVHAAEVPFIEIYGTEGTLSVPNPDTFGGPVRLFRAVDPSAQKPISGETTDIGYAERAKALLASGQFYDIPLMFKYSENGRGVGLSDLAASIETGRPPRASGDLVLHCLEVMTSFEKSSKNQSFLSMTTTCQRPAPMDRSLPTGILD